MTATAHPVFARLQQLAQHSPVVTAHRGDSRHFPENTLAAFRAATALGKKSDSIENGLPAEIDASSSMPNT